jgi:hypothetical protein
MVMEREAQTTMPFASGVDKAPAAKRAFDTPKTTDESTPKLKICTKRLK